MEELIENLNSTKSGERKKAAKKIGKENRTELGEALLNALIKELENSKAWEAQSLMITSLGVIQEKKALQILKNICLENKEHDLVTNFAARAYVRIQRENLSDISPINELLKFGKFSVVSGAFEVIGEDQMLFSKDEISSLIEFANKFPAKVIRGVIDFRIGLVNACINWDKDITKEFLQSCIDQTDDVTLKNAAIKVKSKQK